MKKQIILPIVLAIIFLPSITAKAWVEPDQMPPAGNITAPLNSSSFAQTKLGGLILNIGNAIYGLIVKNGNSGFGTETPTERVDVNGNIKLNGKIIGLQTPTDANDGVNKGYVDNNTASKIYVDTKIKEYIDNAIKNIKPPTLKQANKLWGSTEFNKTYTAPSDGFLIQEGTRLCYTLTINSETYGYAETAAGGANGAITNIPLRKNDVFYFSPCWSGGNPPRISFMAFSAE